MPGWAESPKVTVDRIPNSVFLRTLGMLW